MLGIPIYGNHQMFQCSRPKTHVDATPGSEDLALLGLHARSSGHGTHQRDLVAAGQVMSSDLGKATCIYSHMRNLVEKVECFWGW